MHNLQKTSDIFGSQHSLADPFIFDDDLYLLSDIKFCISLATHLFSLNPQYQHALQRTVNHFITDLDFANEGSIDSQDTLYDELKHGLIWRQIAGKAGMECSIYGNSFVRFNAPFERVIYHKPKGKTVEYVLTWEFALKHRVKFIISEMKYELDNPNNRHERIKMEFRDRPLRESSKAAFRLIPPSEVELSTSPFSGKSRVIWTLNPRIRSIIKGGEDIFQNLETPRQVIKVIQADEDFAFREDGVFHMKGMTMSELSEGNWGIPQPILHYRALRQLEVYRKIDKAIGEDFLTPFRIFTPGEEGSQTNDSFHKLGGNLWKKGVAEMIKRRRQDPKAIHAFTGGLKFNEFGATGKQLVPKDLIEFDTQALMDASSIPVEMQKSTMNVALIPTTIRIFENTFQSTYDNLNALVSWMADKNQTLHRRPLIKTSLQLPSLANDLDIRGIQMELVQAGEFSRAKGYRWAGVDDPVAEIMARMDEDIAIAKGQQEKEIEAQREMEGGSMHAIIGQQNQMVAEQQAAAQQGGGAPANGQMSPPMDVTADMIVGGGILGVDEKGKEMAMMLLEQPYPERRRQLSKIEATNPTLYAVVKRYMEKRRSQAASEGRASVSA